MDESILFLKAQKVDQLKRILKNKKDNQINQNLKTGERAINTLMQLNKNLVLKISKSYQNKGFELNNIIDAGNLGLYKAILKFKPNMGYEFPLYAQHWIHHYITKKLNLPSYLKEMEKDEEKKTKKDSKTAEEVDSFLKIDIENHFSSSLVLESVDLIYNLELDSNDGLLYEGKILLEKENYEKAILKFNKQIKITIHNIKKNWIDLIYCRDSYYLRGYTFYKLKEYIKAKNDFDMVLTIDQKYYSAFYWRGHTNYILKNYSAAFQDTAKVLSIYWNKEKSSLYQNALKIKNDSKLLMSLVKDEEYLNKNTFDPKKELRNAIESGKLEEERRKAEKVKKTFIRSSIINYPTNDEFRYELRLCDNFFYGNWGNHIRDNDNYLFSKEPNMNSGRFWHIKNYGECNKLIEDINNVARFGENRTQEELIDLISFIFEEKINLFIGTDIKEEYAAYYYLSPNTIIINSDYLMHIDFMCICLTHELIHIIQQGYPLKVEIEDSIVSEIVESYKHLSGDDLRLELEAGTYENIPYFIRNYKKDKSNFLVNSNRDYTIDWICRNRRLPSYT